MDEIYEMLAFTLIYYYFFVNFLAIAIVDCFDQGCGPTSYKSDAIDGWYKHTY